MPDVIQPISIPELHFRIKRAFTELSSVLVATPEQRDWIGITSTIIGD